jgi:hypothetical protein
MASPLKLFVDQSGTFSPRQFFDLQCEVFSKRAACCVAFDAFNLLFIFAADAVVIVNRWRRGFFAVSRLVIVEPFSAVPLSYPHYQIGATATARRGRMDDCGRKFSS